MRRLLCFLGLHKWEYYKEDRWYIDRVCSCGQFEIFGNHKKHRAERL